MTAPQIPGSFSVPPAAPVYVDGVPLALAAPPGATSSNSQDYWSSQLRLPGDQHAEQLTVSLAQERLINYITLDLPHFPHTLSVYWWDGANWQPVIGPGNAPLQIVVSGSVPSVVSNPAALAAGLNPCHYGAGHWVHYDEQITPVITTRLMLSGVRPVQASGLQKFPVDPRGRLAPYPLGMQNLDFGSRLLSSGDVPPAPRDPGTLTMRQPFATTKDVNGSPVQVAIRENRASDLLRGATWRCAPQPSASAVTCLYLDSRDSNGNAQLIDRFLIEPVTSGVRFNLYYSPVPPPSDVPFTALDDPLLPSLVQVAGTSLPVTDLLGIVFPAAPGWLTLANQAAGTVADEPWWTGIEIMPAFSSADQGSYVIADAGLIQLLYTSGVWQVVAAASPGSAPGVLAEWEFSHAAGDRLQFIAGYDGQNLFAWCPRGSFAHGPAVPPVPPAPVFRFGALQNIGSGPVLTGNYRLTGFVLKQEQIVVTDATIPDDFLAFAAGAVAYISPPLDSDQGTTGNAVARFSPQFILGSVSPWGFVGGLGSAYASCPWIPVQRDYALAAGYVEFAPALAAAWKFEFTCLQPEPFEYFAPVSCPVNSFPPKPGSSQDQDSASEAVLDQGLTVNQAVAPSISFSDAPFRPGAPAAGTALPTEALYATDLHGAAQMAARGGSLYNFQPWQPTAAISCAQATGPSAYRQDDIVATSRVAYFVAISGISMYRLSYITADDTERYLDTFADTANVDPSTLVPGGWAWQAGTGLVAPSNLTGLAPLQSAVFNSAHAVTGVQFATVQSEAVQLLSDPDFSDPDFTYWAPAGDALPLTFAPVNAQIGSMVRVSRGSGAPALGLSASTTWAGLQLAYANWAVLEAAIPSWYSFGTQAGSASIGGIGYAGDPVPTTPGGRIYAAARIFTPSALSAPLHLQLLDGATSAVIAEMEQAVAAGGITEWFAGFTLGDSISSQASWSQVMTSWPAWSGIIAAVPLWNQIDTSVTPLGATVTVRLVQLADTTDVWDVDNLSVFEDAMVWEFSNDGGVTWYPAYDVRNNPRGVVTFPPAAPGQGGQLMWQLSAYRPGISVSSLAIRPWYATYPHGVMPRAAGIGHGPNLSPADQYGPIEDDPHWQQSSSPIPRSWYFDFRQTTMPVTPGEDFPGPSAPPADAILGAALVYELPALAGLGPETFTDIYVDVYTDTYAPADAGDVFTDSYSDTYGADYTVLTGAVQSAVVSLAATGLLSATAADVPPQASGLGADFGPVLATDSSISSWVASLGHVPVRRVAMGNQIPASLAASVVAGDAGVRRVLLDFRPDATTIPAQLDTFLASCQAGGLQASVSIWAGADKCFTNLQDYLELLPDYVAVIRRNGYQHVFTIDNASIISNALVAWYPGDNMVDVIAPFFWCSGPAPGSGGDTLALAASFADAQGKPFGLAGFGADRSVFTTAQADAFLSYVLQFFTALRAASVPTADLIYLAQLSFSLAGAPAQLIADYQRIAAAL